VFSDGQLPADAVTDQQFMETFIAQRRAQLAALQPEKKKDFTTSSKVLLPLWRHTLQLEWPQADARVSFGPLRTGSGFQAAPFRIQRAGEDQALSGIRFTPARPRRAGDTPPSLVLLAHADGAGSYCDAGQDPQGLAKHLIERGCGVVVITEFSAIPTADALANFYTTYNRTLLQHRVRDLLTICSSVGRLSPPAAPKPRLVLCGEGQAGLWTVLAAPGADAVVADGAGFPSDDDQALLAADVFCPGFRSLGGWRTAVLLAAPHPLLLHNTGQGLELGGLQRVYRTLAAARKLRVETAPLDEESLARQLSRF
jgi:hypothetical protein